MLKDKSCLGARLFSALAGIIFILIGVDFYVGAVPGLKTVTASTAIIAIIVGIIGIILAVVDKGTGESKLASTPPQAPPQSPPQI